MSIKNCQTRIPVILTFIMSKWDLGVVKCCDWETVLTYPRDLDTSFVMYTHMDR